MQQASGDSNNEDHEPVPAETTAIAEDPESAPPQPQLTIEQTLEKMRADWDERAKENARYYVATGNSEWTEEDFYASGETTINEQIRNDLENICQGKPPRAMRIIEIGCGAGRLTRALAHPFGEVHAVDISAEMVRLARQAVRDEPNAYIYRNNGADLSVLPDSPPFDFAFSYVVFQHIPSRDVVENYVREVHRLLRPGALFKFQVQGGMQVELKPGDTWVGVPFSEQQARDMAERCGFEMRYAHGAGEQYYWLWFFRK